MSQSPKCRVCACARYYGKTVKLAWISEDDKGVYFGLFGRGSGFHFSYHVDGTTWFKSPGETVALLEAKKRPLQRITDSEQLVVQAINVSPATVQIHGDPFANCGNPTVNVFVGGDHTDAAPATINISAYIVFHGFEQQWTDTLFQAYAGACYVVVGLVVLPLARFPEHRAAVAITAYDELPSSPE
jgi:hypothetical protein